MGRIGIYGGSFNPPHLGHALAIREMKTKLELDKVIVVPAAVPPHKALASNSPSVEMRLKMLKLALEGIEDVEISDIELTRKGPSYTVDTIQMISAQNPDSTLFLLMGSDMFLTFSQWRAPEEICRHAVIAAMHRCETDTKAGLFEAQAAALRTQFRANVTLLENEFEEMSSTSVRRMLLFRCAESYLSPAVLQFIEENALYDVGKSLRALPFEQLKELSLSLLDEGRRAHVVGCCETAAYLARRWGADERLAARAGILHDVTKALDKRAQLLLCEKYGIMTSAFERTHYKILHSKTGAAVARHIFGECDEIFEAIFWHTTGKENMSLLEKILYIADYMEPNRSFDGVQLLRDLTETDLDAAMLCGFQMSIDLLESEGKALDRYTVAARDFLLSERNNP